MNLISERPANIEELGPILDHLVTYGGARVAYRWQVYLRSVGVARGAADGEWMWPTRHFLMDALPAASVTDLIRRAVIRDPLYRMHLDLCLISVVHSIARAERWRRAEEILFGLGCSVAPRLMQLLDWQMVRTVRSARDLSVEDWNQTSQEIVAHCANTFLAWDRYLWGDCRRLAELFPVLLDLYVPLCNQPVHFWRPNDQDELEIGALLRCIVNAAGEGEGVIFSMSEHKRLEQLQNLGIPIRTWNVNERHLVASLVGRVACESEGNESRGELSQVPSGVPTLAKESYLLGDENSRPPTEWSRLGSHAKTTIALYSLPMDSTRWPTGSSSDHPDWLRLPGADVLATADRRKSDSPAADQALLQIAGHPLYGFMLQLLLLEALDRELGEETVVLALPQNRKLESLEDWANTKVLYRPSGEKIDGDIQSAGFLMLGPIDEVVNTLAHEAGNLRVVSPYTMAHGGPWSRALFLMNTAGLVDGRPDRWILAITNHILDRLHTSLLMREVIRNGRTERDRIHQILMTFWQDKSKSQFKERVSA